MHGISNLLSSKNPHTKHKLSCFAQRAPLSCYGYPERFQSQGNPSSSSAVPFLMVLHESMAGVSWDRKRRMLMSCLICSVNKTEVT